MAEELKLPLTVGKSERSNVNDEVHRIFNSVDQSISPFVACVARQVSKKEFKRNLEIKRKAKYGKLYILKR